MIKITEDVFILREDVVSIQREIVTKFHSTSPSDCGYETTEFNGSVITMKNGRKIFIPTLVPVEIQNLLDGKN